MLSIPRKKKKRIVYCDHYLSLSPSHSLTFAIYNCTPHSAAHCPCNIVHRWQPVSCLQSPSTHPLPHRTEQGSRLTTTRRYKNPRRLVSCFLFPLFGVFQIALNLSLCLPPTSGLSLAIPSALTEQREGLNSGWTKPRWHPANNNTTSGQDGKAVLEAGSATDEH